MMIRISLLVCFAWTFCAGALAAPPIDKDRVVVLISLDGLAAEKFDDPKAEMPMLRELAEQGARSTGMLSSVPTVTWPNHTTLITGVHPARHGVLGNNYFDRKTDKRVTLIGDPIFDKDEIVKVPTIFDVAKKAGLTTASVRWPATRNSKSLDWTTPDSLNKAIMEKYTTPSLVDDARKAGWWVKPEAKPDGLEAAPADAANTKIFVHILKKHRPNFAMLHLIDVDHESHKYGPHAPEAYAAIKAVDGFVREVWDTMQAEFPGKATIVIASDHGFSEIKRMVLPNVILRQAGILKGPGTGELRGPVRILPQGGCAFVYFLEDKDQGALVQQVTKAFTGVEGVREIVPPERLKDLGVATPNVDPNGPDMVIFAEDGNIFGDTAAGALTFIDKPERKGSHGHDPKLPNLHATFIASGTGIRPGTILGEISNTSVAPTIADLLGLEMADVDGEILFPVLNQ